MKLLFLDSGVGGLSIYQDVMKVCPSVNALYIGDNSALPYGGKTDSFIIERVVALILHFSIHYQPDIIVIACNTASTLALPYLRAFTQIPIVGTVPAIKVAASITTNRKIGLLATPATIERAYVTELMASFASDCHLVRIGSSRLVHIAEEKLMGQTPNFQEIKLIVDRFLQQKIDTCVLGCTHFPLLKDELEAIAPEITWIDSGSAIAERIKSLINQLDKQNSTNDSEEIQNTAEFTGIVHANLRNYLQNLGFQNIVHKIDTNLNVQSNLRNITFIPWIPSTPHSLY